MTLAKDYNEVGKLAREIVAKRVLITTTVSTALSAALAEGWISVDLDNQATKYVAIGLGAVAALVSVLWSRDAVTPADPALNPTSVAGEALVAVPGTAARAARPVPDAASIATAAAAALTAPVGS